MPVEKYSKSKYKKRAGTKKKRKRRTAEAIQNTPYKIQRIGPGPNDTPSPRMDGTLIPQGQFNISPPRADMNAIQLAATYRPINEISALDKKTMHRGPASTEESEKAMAAYLTIEVGNLEDKIYSLEEEALGNGYSVLNPNWNDKKESSAWSVLPHSRKLDIAKSYHTELRKHLKKAAKKEKKEKKAKIAHHHSYRLNRSLKNVGMGLPFLLGAQLYNTSNNSMPQSYQTPLLPPGDPNVRSRIASNYPFKQIITDPRNPLYYSQTIGDHDGINLETPGAIEKWDDIISNAVSSQLPMTEYTMNPYINPEHARDNKQYTGPAAPKQLTRRDLKKLKKLENAKNRGTQKRGYRQKPYTKGTRPRNTHR